MSTKLFGLKQLYLNSYEHGPGPRSKPPFPHRTWHLGLTLLCTPVSASVEGQQCTYGQVMQARRTVLEQQMARRQPPRRGSWEHDYSMITWNYITKYLLSSTNYTVVIFAKMFFKLLVFCVTQQMSQMYSQIWSYVRSVPIMFQGNFCLWRQGKERLSLWKKRRQIQASYQQDRAVCAPLPLQGLAQQQKKWKLQTKHIYPCEKGISCSFTILIIPFFSPSPVSFCGCFISKYITLVIRNPQKC